MSIAILPNELICKILEKFALQERLKLRLVCSRWCILSEELCRKKKSLKLFDRYASILKIYSNSYLRNDEGKYWALKDIPQDDDLVLDFVQLKKPLSAALARLFPNVTHLGVYSTDECECAFWDVSYLLGAYSDTLVSLTLFVNEFNDICNKDILSIINRMSALKQLHLFFQYTSDVYIQLFNHISQVLPQLESITLPNSACSTPPFRHPIQPIAVTQVAKKGIFSGLWKFFRSQVCRSTRHRNRANGPAPITQPTSTCSIPALLYSSPADVQFALTHLRLNCMGLFSRWDRHSISVLQWNQLPLCANLTNLRFHQMEGRFYELIKWDKLPSLQYLFISFRSNDNKPLTNLFRDLSQLPNLAELELHSVSLWTTDGFTFPHSSTPLSRVTKFTLTKLFENWDLEETSDVREPYQHNFISEHFCRTLSFWLPNLEHLDVESAFAFMETEIEQNLHLFPHMQHDRLIHSEKFDTKECFGRHSKSLTIPVYLRLF